MKTEQLELKFKGRARKRDPKTSKDAAKSVGAAAISEQVYDTLRFFYGGMTSEEVSDWLKLDRVTVSPRFRPLCEAGLIYDSGKKRAGKSGKMAIVWKVI